MLLFQVVRQVFSNERIIRKRRTEKKVTDRGEIIRTRSKSPPYEVDKMKVGSWKNNFLRHVRKFKTRAARRLSTNLAPLSTVRYDDSYSDLSNIATSIRPAGGFRCEKKEIEIAVSKRFPFYINLIRCKTKKNWSKSGFMVSLGCVLSINIFNRT